EDGLAENILPRLEASNADLTKVTSIAGLRERDDDTKQDLAWTFQLDRDFPFLETRLRSLQEAGTNVRLLVIDPIECFLESATGKKKAAIERLSARLAKLAMETNVAIVVVSNLPRNVKGTSKMAQSIRRTVDLGPFGSAARSVWMVGQDLENQNRRLLLPVKTNYCELPKSLAYQIDGGVIEWEKEPPTLTSDEYLAECDDYIQDQKRAARDEQSQLNFAVRWLRTELSQCPLPATTVNRDAADNQISSATLRRARAELQVRSEKYAFAGPWNWSLPETAATSSEEEQAETEAEGLDEGAQEGGQEGGHDSAQGDGHKDGLDIGFEGASEGAHEDDQPRPWPTGERRRR
ncbi:MAG: DnaB-like helicase C-terminal domain-containing protein, partial [Schlesneria sp.]